MVALTQYTDTFNAPSLMNYLMKKIVLLGDSIRLIGYGTKVPEMLGENYILVANLPYYITTPIVMRFIEEAKNVNAIVITIQKEDFRVISGSLADKKLVKEFKDLFRK